MKRFMFAALSVLIIFSLCGCKSNKKWEEEAYAYTGSFLAEYKSGKITAANAKDYFDTEKSKKAYELFIADESLTSPKALRKRWNVDNTVLSDKQLYLICDKVNAARTKRISYSIESAKGSKIKKNCAYVKAVLKHPYNDSISEDNANNAVLKAANVKDYGELMEKFLKERQLSEDETKTYEQEQFSKEFFGYIVSNYIPSALIDIMETAPQKKESLTFTVEKKDKKAYITKIEVE